LKKLQLKEILFPCSFFALCFFMITSSGSAQNTQSQPAKKLTIERLYSLPWVIGTKPDDPQWSPDSQHLAFLWNNEGTNFYDVWMADTTTYKPVRITSMPRPENPADAGTDVKKLQQVAKAETDRGVSSVIWAPDAKHLIFVFHGQLYRVLPGSAPEKLTDSAAIQSDAASAPRNNQVAYISDNDLWVIRFDGKKPINC
jgi:dipeptidyl-peptidase-4